MRDLLLPPTTEGREGVSPRATTPTDVVAAFHVRIGYLIVQIAGIVSRILTTERGTSRGLRAIAGSMVSPMPMIVSQTKALSTSLPMTKRRDVRAEGAPPTGPMAMIRDSVAPRAVVPIVVTKEIGPHTDRDLAVLIMTRMESIVEGAALIEQGIIALEAAAHPVSLVGVREVIWASVSRPALPTISLR